MQKVEGSEADENKASWVMSKQGLKWKNPLSQIQSGIPTRNPYSSKPEGGSNLR